MLCMDYFNADPQVFGKLSRVSKSKHKLLDHSNYLTIISKIESNFPFSLHFRSRSVLTSTNFSHQPGHRNGTISYAGRRTPPLTQTHSGGMRGPGNSSDSVNIQLAATSAIHRRRRRRGTGHEL